MMLRQDYLAATPWLANWLLAFLVCLGFCYAFLAWSQRRPTVYLLWSTPVSILVQLILGVLLFYLGISLYEYANLHLDVVPVLLALSLAGYALAWTGVLDAGYKKRRSLFRRATGWYVQHRHLLWRHRWPGRRQEQE